MKKLYPLLLLGLIGCFSCNSTKPTNKLVIVYDHATSTLVDMPEEGFRIKYGGTPTIVIDNINSSQYDIEVDEEQLSVTYNTESGEEDEEGGRNLAGAGDIIPEVPEDKKIQDRQNLFERANALLNTLTAYNSTNISYLDKSYESLTTSTDLSYDQVKTRKDELDAVFIPLKDDILNNYNRLVNEFLFLSSQLLELSAEDETAAALQSGLESAFEDLKEIDLTSEVIKIERLRDLLNENHFRATYHAPVVRADEVVYTLTIETKDETPSVQRRSVVPIMVRVAGNWKIDVSSGVMFNIGITDRSYRLDVVEDDSLTLRENTKNSGLTPTVGIMTHVYKKRTDYTNYGISFGLGINDEQRLRYYGGIGLMLGEKQRFVISGGITAAPRTVLHGKYHKGQKFEASSAPAPETLTEEAYRIGGFFSLTYNLSSNSVKAASSKVQGE